MKLITLYMPEKELSNLNELVKKKHYPHRSEAIRLAVRDLINSELKENQKQ